MKLFPAIMLMFCIVVSGCQSASKEYEETSRSDQNMSADSSSTGILSSSAAVENNHDPSHLFVRTADLKFRVRNVEEATAGIETITAQQGGFVTFTDLSSTVEERRNVSISRDSSLETMLYGVTNTMTLRVPNIHLDSTLKEIARTVDYLDFRVIRADDVALQLLSNELTQKRLSQHQARLRTAIDVHKSKLTEAVQAEENLAGKDERSSAALLTNLSLADQISFSTVKLEIYQRQGVRSEKVAIINDIPAYTPPLGSRLADALRTGWGSFLDLLVFFTACWPLILTGIAAYFLFRTYRRPLVK